MNWQTRFLASRKLVFLLQAAFVCFLAGSLLFGFTNIRPTSWRPNLGSLKKGTHTTIKQAEGEIERAPFSNTTNGAGTNPLKDGNATLLQMAPKYVKAILTPEDTLFDRLSCPAPETTRYHYLQSTTPAKVDSNRPQHWKYFFALDLTECLHTLPRLIGSVIETIHFLGPQNCALSIVEGHSTDGTYEVLLSLRKELEESGITYYFTTSDINPKAGHRIAALAKLRNLALRPLFDNADKLPSNDDTTILFINDVSLCMEDILELIHQRQKQSADM
ncbi:MAG: hypothetical protein Q9225_005915, partial [Loekoesia sp. 1 TL-2023]